MSGIAQPLGWHDLVWQRLMSAYHHERLPHAVLLSGAVDTGKRIFASALAQRLLCTTKDGNVSCGRCKGCQLNSAGTHPDLTILAPEDAGKAIGIDDIRDLAMTVSKTGQQGGWKVVVILPAEAMTASAANALLKTLEEPQGQTLIILVSHELGRLPATIRSRCQRYVLPQPSTAEALAWLQAATVNNDAASQALSLAQGRPLLARQYLEDGLLERHRQFDSWLDEIAAGRLAPLEAAQLCQKSDAIALADWFLLYLHSRLCADSNNPVNREIFTFYDKLRKVRGWLASASNPNSQLIWEELFFDWLALSKASARRVAER